MNPEKLEEEMKKKHITKGEMCKILGISRTAFYRKSKGITEFTRDEILKIVKALHLKSPVAIFFTD